MAGMQKKLAQVAQKQSHKGQFGWNKNNKVSQLMLQIITIFLRFQMFSLPQNMQNSTKMRLGPYELSFFFLFFFLRGGHFGIRCIQ